MTSDSSAVRDGPLEVGQTFLGKYEIHSRIGRGGHAWVYDAYNSFLGAHVAIKTLHCPGGVTQDMLRRGQAEAQLMNRLRHQNVVEVIDAGVTQDGLLYIVMELLRGRSLRDVLTDNGCLEVDEALSIGAQIADGAYAAHQAGAIHRDLKPENVFVLPENRVKILDFGIAKLVDVAAWTTDRNMVLGTMLYMSPEQVQSRPLTQRSDIYALGVTLFEALLGVHPVRLLVPDPDANAWAITRAIVSKIPPMLHELDARIPRSVASLVQQLMAKVPEQRFASMQAVSSAIRECLAARAPSASARHLYLPPRDLSRQSGLSQAHQLLGPHGTEPLPGTRLPALTHDTEPSTGPMFLGASFANTPGPTEASRPPASSSLRAGALDRSRLHSKASEALASAGVLTPPETAPPVSTPLSTPIPGRADLPGFKPLSRPWRAAAVVTVVAVSVTVLLFVVRAPRRADQRAASDSASLDRPPARPPVRSATTPAASSAAIHRPLPPPAASSQPKTNASDPKVLPSAVPDAGAPPTPVKSPQRSPKLAPTLGHSPARPPATLKSDREAWLE